MGATGRGNEDLWELRACLQLPQTPPVSVIEAGVRVSRRHFCEILLVAGAVAMLRQDLMLDSASSEPCFFLCRCNKLGLDRISSAEEPSPEEQVEEATVFTCAQSAPLNQEPVVCADIGTAHSAAVTGVCPDP